MRISFTYTNAVFGGFGTLAKGIENGLRNAGHTITEDNPDVCLAYGVPNVMDEARAKHPDKPLIFYTVWESSEYPGDWVEHIKNAKVDYLLTASEFTKKSLIKAGVDKDKIGIWHHGVDDVWSYRERRDDGVFTFIHYNAYEWRKGWDIVLGAFLEEFEEDEDVKLLLLARERDYANWIVPINKSRDSSIDYPNVEEKLGYFSREELADLIGRADCGVFPVHGEGWFLPATECVAQGLVVLMPNQMAMAEQWNAGCIDIGLDGYLNAYPRYPGWMIQPSKDDLRKKMRWCFENQEECKEMGRKGSQEVKERFNWSKIIKDLEQYLSLVLENNVHKKPKR